MELNYSSNLDLMMPHIMQRFSQLNIYYILGAGQGFSKRKDNNKYFKD